ncbi:efflux RND transporter periplasmic adaptor subunit [Oxalobacteraceae bacterium CAVE-383]|nr:efflux RND transporter periplasmic adaptor subunit [Oxalobacteraceae bacterium CAVE-383]
MSLVSCLVSRNTRIALTVVALAALAACGKKPDAGAGGPPPTEVSIITVAPQRLAISDELPGRLEATRIAQVRARVPGIILKRTFREGSDVKAGDVLFRIDPAPLQAAFASAQAAQARAEATAAQASAKAKRYQPLVEVNAVSRQEYDDAVAAQKTAEADVLTARAARQTAALNLGYATVTAPISGRIGRALVTEGALVGQADVTQLALIQQLDPIYVNLTQSSNEVLSLKRALANGKLKASGNGQAKVTLLTDDGQPYPQAGKLLFSDLSVDQSTGEITLRAEFPNPQRTLLPGMYVRARLEQGVDENALTVPQQAVVRDVGGSVVMLVGADNKVVAQPVTTGASQGNVWIIKDGVKQGDRVIVEGLQKIKPGATVNPVPWKDPSQAAKAPAAQQPAPAAAAAPAAQTKAN